MKLIILYEMNKYTTEINQNFTREDILYNIRKKLGHEQNQKYNLWDEKGVLLKYRHTFYIDNLPKEMTLFLMKIPEFKSEETLYSKNIIKDITNTIGDIKFYDELKKLPLNHGNPEKEREQLMEYISNIQFSFNDLPDLEKETIRK